jgi:hypothetical protein
MVQRVLENPLILIFWIFSVFNPKAQLAAEVDSVAVSREQQFQCIGDRKMAQSGRL